MRVPYLWEAVNPCSAGPRYRVFLHSAIGLRRAASLLRRPNSKIRQLSGTGTFRVPLSQSTSFLVTS